MWNFLTSLVTAVITLVFLCILLYGLFFTQAGLFFLFLAVAFGVIYLITRDKV